MRCPRPSWSFFGCVLTMGLAVACTVTPDPAYSPAGAPPPPGAYPPPSSGADATPLSGRWQGTYFCGQGPTGLELRVTGYASGHLQAVFRFYPLPDNPRLPSGSFRMTGSLAPDGAFYLSATERDWIIRPYGSWRVVSIQGRMSPDGTEILGTIPECSSNFRLGR